MSFNDLLTLQGYALENVRYLRHCKTERDSVEPFDLWTSDKPTFDAYQSEHGKKVHDTLKNATTWASFVGTPSGDTIFVGVYRAKYVGEAQGRTNAEGITEKRFRYDIALEACLDSYRGRLLIEWGRGGERAFVQRADRQTKLITEIRKNAVDPPFPGYLSFISTLRQLDTLPATWVALLRAVRGIYVLTCPEEHYLYVGSATGVDGFFGRWSEEAGSRLGGNVRLMARGPRDYQVAILEVAGSAMSDDEILGLESRWKQKLQSREMGLNAN